MYCKNVRRIQTAYGLVEYVDEMSKYMIHIGKTDDDLDFIAWSIEDVPYVIIQVTKGYPEPVICGEPEKVREMYRELVEYLEKDIKNVLDSGLV